MGGTANSRWRKKAEVLAQRFPRERFHPAVLAWAENRRTPWAIAFSGGADSLSLLLLLWAHWPKHRRQMMALHFNHRLRGRAADADERFCRGVCSALGISLKVGRWRQSQPGASEEEARAARFAFFSRTMQRARARALWLGHHQGDIAETMLMRLARGSGTGGLAAPRPVQMVGDRVHLRPLLTLKKEDLMAELRSVGISWREDRTNAGGAYFRNRIRHDVLPAWQKAAGRDAVASAAWSRELLDEDDAALEAWLDALKLVSSNKASLKVSDLAGYPRALARRALRRWLMAQPLAGELSRQGFEDLLTAIVAGKSTRRSLGTRGFAMIRGGALRFARISSHSGAKGRRI